jgi:hypothetical protein
VVFVGHGCTEDNICPSRGVLETNPGEFHAGKGSSLLRFEIAELASESGPTGGDSGGPWVDRRSGDEAVGIFTGYEEILKKSRTTRAYRFTGVSSAEILAYGRAHGVFLPIAVGQLLRVKDRCWEIVQSLRRREVPCLKAGRIIKKTRSKLRLVTENDVASIALVHR